MLPERIYEPLLAVKSAANLVADDAIVTYYTKSEYHLGHLEASMEVLERRLASLRAAFAASRSRGKDPMTDA